MEPIVLECYASESSSMTDSKFSIRDITLYCKTESGKELKMKLHMLDDTNELNALTAANKFESHKKNIKIMFW